MGLETILANNGESKALYLFHYIPVLAPAAVALALYGLMTIYLTIRIYISKSPRFLYILAFTALMETIGFAIRLKCHFFTDLGKYVGMTLFLLLAPNALALVNYKAVGEIIRLSNVEEKRYYLRPKFVTWFFFGSDIFSFCLQGAGGGLQSTVGYNEEGRIVTLIGLAVQLIFFGCFAAITVYVHRHSRYNYYVENSTNPKKNLILCLYVTIVLLYIRSIYRVAEYATGYGGPIARLEWAFYVFDTIIIFISFIVYSIFFIGDYLPKYDSINNSQRASSKCSSSSSSSSSQTERSIDIEKK
ncbi:RTA1 like protein-domain-containing protein [Cokeromyces recurvatus]|uniref:RTA1 like protein-domain-containing protein n=1 Tax=Cokeromyces recurvatus TaxID=90255 RepID=UPI00221FED64|nr:RTA1 like protein-domain-containing protein [Cokeromyces recurvatus]KAI7907993.1 RTA1 like protein-domain-containing protein [Cokeromyces recurvatus]